MECLPINQQSYDYQMVLLHVPKLNHLALNSCILFFGHNISNDVQTLFLLVSSAFR